MKVKVRCIKEYYDLELGVVIKPTAEDKNYERVITRDRADTLEGLKLIEVLHFKQINLKYLIRLFFTNE